MIEKFDMNTHAQMFGKAVVRLRKDARMEQEQLAERSGVPQAKLARIEKGSASPDSFGLQEICKLTSAMKITPYALMMECEKLAREAGQAWW